MYMYQTDRLDSLVCSRFCCAYALCPFKISKHLDGEERDGCFTIYVFLLSCGYCCSVAPPHGAVGWSAVCDCGIF